MMIRLVKRGSTGDRGTTQAQPGNTLELLDSRIDLRQRQTPDADETLWGVARVVVNPDPLPLQSRNRGVEGLL
jgi:hypothetical protein